MSVGLDPWEVMNDDCKDDRKVCPIIGILILIQQSKLPARCIDLKA